MEGVLRIINAKEGMKPPKDGVDSRVPTPAILPALNHSLVIAMDNKVLTVWVRVTYVGSGRNTQNQLLWPNQCLSDPAGFAIQG